MPASTKRDEPRHEIPYVRFYCVSRKGEKRAEIWTKVFLDRSMLVHSTLPRLNRGHRGREECKFSYANAIEKSRTNWYNNNFYF